MHRCIQCGNESSFSLKCLQCGFSPVYIDGFAAYAPHSNQQASGFPEDFFSQLRALEDKNFWFRARNKLISRSLHRSAPDFSSFLEIGCGTGCVLECIADQFPNARILGSELFTSGLSFARARLQRGTFMQMDARNIPFSGEFDVVGAFDVLEHIVEDEDVLFQVHRALKPSGIFLLTVPQHPWLWSAADDHAYHVRRYQECDLLQKLKDQNFKILRNTSFVSILLPLMMYSRFRQRNRKKNYRPEDELDLPKAINFIFYLVMKFELFLIGLGIDFKAGGSRFVMAQKM